VLLDLGLPDSKGVQTFIRMHQLAPRVPILVLTGLADQDAGLQAIKNGAQDYLVKKDVQTELVSRSVRYALERAKTARRLEALEKFELNPSAGLQAASPTTLTTPWVSFSAGRKWDIALPLTAADSEISLERFAVRQNTRRGSPGSCSLLPGARFYNPSH
jgi:DNA-binding response OmpR family regulator